MPFDFRFMGRTGSVLYLLNTNVYIIYVGDRAQVQHGRVGGNVVQPSQPRNQLRFPLRVNRQLSPL
jgi:hypothetical protein